LSSVAWLETIQAMKTTHLILLSLITLASAALAVDPPLDEGSDNALASWSWRNGGRLNTPRINHTATLLSDGTVLVAGGFNAGDLASAELFNPASRTWLAAGNLNVVRTWHTATLLQNGMVLVAGGETIGGNTASAELYDPASGTWTATGSLNTARQQHKATLLQNGMVLVVGGAG
jgi:hypothetical protein